MAKIIVSATHKGGEGKTTNSIFLAEYAALVLGKKTLAIDLDPQGNFSGRYIKMEFDPVYVGGKIPGLHPAYNAEEDVNWDGRSSIADIFYGKELFPYPTSISNLEILPANSSRLQDAEAVTKNEVVEKVHVQLKRFLTLPDVQAAYDIIIIDTPPSKGPLTISAIKAATHLVVPSQMEEFSIQGIYGMLQLWKQESYARPKDAPIELVGILPNQLRDIKLHHQFLEGLKQAKGIGNYVIPHTVKKRAIYTEILVEGAQPRSVFELPASHIARQECEMVCRYIMEKVYDGNNK